MSTSKMSRGPLKIHPFALLMPRANDEDYSRLENSIRKYGVKVPIVLFNGMIIDGCSRYSIATKLGKPVPVEEFQGTARNALEMVAVFNMDRRHLTQSQKAMVAARLAQELTAIDGMPAPEARETAAKAVGAALSTTERAERLDRTAPRVAEKVMNGTTTIGKEIGRTPTRHECPKCGFKWETP